MESPFPKPAIIILHIEVDYLRAYPGSRDPSREIQNLA